VILRNLILKMFALLGVVAHPCNSDIQGDGSRKAQVQGPSELHSDILSQKPKIRKQNKFALKSSVKLLKITGDA
jgi:hypothetical protein